MGTPINAAADISVISAFNETPHRPPIRRKFGAADGRECNQRQECQALERPTAVLLWGRGIRFAIEGCPSSRVDQSGFDGRPGHLANAAGFAGYVGESGYLHIGWMVGCSAGGSEQNPDYDTD
jgi:hypothetical protein